MKNKNERLSEVLSLAPVIPVLQFDDPETAVLTSQALVAFRIEVEGDRSCYRLQATLLARV